MLPAGPCASGLPDVAALLTGTAAEDISIGLPRTMHSAPVTGKSQVSVRCASFNVCTFANDTREAGHGLYTSGVQSLLKEQCHCKALGIVGLQETRLPTAGQFVTEHYVVINAAASQHNYGCSLWLARQSLLGAADARASTPLGLQHCTTLVSEPRLLIVRVRAVARSWLCIVAHAPHARRPEEERVEWWDTLGRSYVAHKLPSDVVFLCIDANARVGKPATAHIGSHAADAATPNGEALAEFLQLADLYLPSTTEIHTGTSVTWTSPTGFQARGDYVAVPLSLRAAVRSSWVWQHPDVMQLRPDHHAPVVEVAYTLESRDDRQLRPRLSVDPLQRESWHTACAELPPMPWRASVDAHAAALAKSLHSRSRPFKLRRNAQPNRPYVVPQVRQLLSFRNHLRRLLHDQTVRERCSILASGMFCWSAILRQAKNTAGSGITTAAMQRVVSDSQRAWRSCRQAIALHLRAYQHAAAHARRVLRAAKRAYAEELGQALVVAAESHDAKAAYDALRRLIPSLRKKAGQHPAVPVLDANCHPLPDAAAKARGWSEHFGLIEGGCETTSKPLEEAHPAHCRRARKPQHPPLKVLPDRLQWEQTFRRVKKGKALMAWIMTLWPSHLGQSLGCHTL